MGDQYSKALAVAKEYLEAYDTVSMLRHPWLTRDQRIAIKTMIADAWLCGYDAAKAELTNAVRENERE